MARGEAIKRAVIGHTVIGDFQDLRFSLSFALDKTKAEQKAAAQGLKNIRTYPIIDNKVQIDK